MTQSPQLFQTLSNREGARRAIEHIIEGELDVILELCGGINHLVQFMADLKGDEDGLVQGRHEANRVACVQKNTAR